MKKLLNLLLLTTCFFATYLHAWNASFHRIGVQIAKENISRKTLKVVDYYIKILSNAPPEYNDMVLAASWLDEIRGDIPFFALYHYRNTLYNPENFSCQVSSTPYDSVFAVKESLKVLKHSHSSNFAKALSLRILIHVVLDIHQPLHSAELCSKDFPKGDRGGNEFSVSMKTQYGKIIKGNLHKFWDEVFLIPIRSHVKVSSQKLMNLIMQDADDLIREVGPISNIMPLDPEVWANESMSIAKNLVYKGIHPHQELATEYVGQAIPVAKRRIVLGGMRLAHLIEEVFKNSVVPKKSFRKK